MSTKVRPIGSHDYHVANNLGITYSGISVSRICSNPILESVFGAYLFFHYPRKIWNLRVPFRHEGLGMVYISFCLRGKKLSKANARLTCIRLWQLGLPNTSDGPLSGRAGCSAAPVHFSAMPDSHHGDDEHIISDLVNDTVDSLTYPISILA